MIGRLLWLVAGLAISVFGLGMWKPALAAKYEQAFDFAKLNLSLFDPYRTVIAFVVMGFGLAVMLAALQREPTKKRIRQGVTLFTEAEEPAPAPAPAAGHDDHSHGHEDHGGHGDHGHGEHAPAPAHH